VLRLPLVGDKLVAGWNCDVDANTERIARALLMVRLLNRDIAATDMIAKPIQARRFRADQMVKFLGLLDTAVRYFERQLHLEVCLVER
jgi:hypothetical protein